MSGRCSGGRCTHCLLRDPNRVASVRRHDAGPMDGIQIGYARVLTTDQDLTAQRDALLRLGVHDVHICVDHGMTGANRARPGLREALAAVRSGDTLVVTKLDRLARSLRDAREIADELTLKGVALSLGGNRYDPTDPVGRLLFDVLAMVAEFERDLISMRTREGMALARAKGRLRVSSRSCRRRSGPCCSGCTIEARTPRPRSRSCSTSRAPPFTGSFSIAVRSSSSPAKRTSSSALEPRSPNYDVRPDTAAAHSEIPAVHPRASPGGGPACGRLSCVVA